MLTKHDIINMKPGVELDLMVCERDEGLTPSTNMNDAWTLRNKFLREKGGTFRISRVHDAFPEYCEIEHYGERVMVWATATPEAICKAIQLWNNGYRGDCHPWKVCPELLVSWLEIRDQPFLGADLRDLYPTGKGRR